MATNNDLFFEQIRIKCEEHLKTQLSSITEQKRELENQNSLFQKKFEEQHTIISKLTGINGALEKKYEKLEDIKKKEALEHQTKIENLKKECQQQINHIQSTRDNALKESAEKVTEFEKQNLNLKQSVTLMNAKNVKSGQTIAALETKLKNLERKQTQLSNELETAKKQNADQKKNYFCLRKKYGTAIRNYAKLEKQKKYYVYTNKLTKKKQLAAEYSLSGYEQIRSKTVNQFKDIMFDINQNLKRCLIEAVDTATKEGVEQTSIAVDRDNCAAQSIISNASIIADESNEMSKCPHCHREFKSVHHLRRHLSIVHLT